MTIQTLIDKAQEVFIKHFPSTVTFERAIFFSWGCTIGDCTFCYMSTQPNNKPAKETRRSNASLLAEFILAKQLGWDIGFFTGGFGVLSPDELEFLLKIAVEMTGEKLWLSVGPVSLTLLERYLPYIKGVVGSTETINPKLHKKVCPSKPLKPYENMFEAAETLGLEKAMTFIVGLGETHDDLQLLINFIQKYNIHKIHVYGLIPQEGTPYEHSEMPTAEDQAWWIAQIRIAFPTIDIQCGIWEDRLEYIPLLLKAGANSISKFKATKHFGTKLAKDIEEQSARAGRTFRGTLTILPDIDWNNEVDKFYIDESLKQSIKEKLQQYLEQIYKNILQLST